MDVFQFPFIQHKEICVHHIISRKSDII